MGRLVSWSVPRLVAVWIVFMLFVGGMVAIAIGIVPLIWRQLYESINAMPGVIDRLREVVVGLAEDYPAMFSPTSVDGWLATLNTQLTEVGSSALQGLVSHGANRRCSPSGPARGQRVDRAAVTLEAHPSTIAAVAERNFVARCESCC